MLDIELNLQVLGRFRVACNGQPISDQGWGTHRAKTIFKLLLTHYGKPVLRDQLIEAVWPDVSQSAGTRNLYTAVSELRRILQPGLARSAESIFILSTDDGYQFNPQSRHILDKEVFTERVRAAQLASQQQALEAAAQAYGQAEGLYGGDYLPDDLYADWSMGERERLRNIFLESLIEAGEVNARLGRYRQAITGCRKALEIDACYEEAYRGLMLYLNALGDRAQALRTYSECCAVLQRELGVEPLPVTSAVEKRIRAGSITGTDAGESYPPPRQVAAPFSPGQMPFVGRRAEIRAMLDLCQAAVNGHGGLVFVTGASGLGKSRLVQKVFGENSSQPVLSGQCQELTQGLPYYPVIQMLRQALAKGLLQEPLPAWMEAVRRLIPELVIRTGTGQPDMAGSPEEKHAQLLAVLQACLLDLSKRNDFPGGAALVIEDLHWADENTLELLAALGPQLAHHRLLVIATCRPGERVRSLLDRAGRDEWVHHLDLCPLAEAEVVRLLEKLAPYHPLVTAFGQRLFKATGGSPLFITTVLARLFETGQLWVDAAGGWQGIDVLLQTPVLPIPEEAHTLVVQRTSALSPAARQILNLAAVIEEDFDLKFIEAVYSRAYPETLLSEVELFNRLDELQEADLLACDETERFTCRHDALREAVYARINPPRRKRLHRAVGLVLEERSPKATARLAHHFSRSDDPARAIRYLLAAAREYRQLFANSAALTAYNQVLEIIHLQDKAGAAPGSWQAELVEAEFSRAAIAAKLGFVEVEKAAAAALQPLLPQLHGMEQMDALAAIAYALSDMEQHKDVLSFTDPILPRLQGAEYARHRANFLRVRGYAFWELGRPQEMSACFETALKDAIRDEQPRRQALAWLYLGVAHGMLARWDEAAAALENARTASTRVDDPYLAATILESGAEVWEGLGCFERVWEDLARSETYYSQAEISNISAELKIMRGRVFLLQDQDEQAATYFEQAIEIARVQRKRRDEALALVGSGLAAARRRAWVASRSFFKEGTDILAALDSQFHLTYACASSALALLEEGDPAAAWQCLILADSAPFSRYTSLAQFARSRCLLAQGNRVPALQALDAARCLILQQAEQISDQKLRDSFLAHPQSRLILNR